MSQEAEKKANVLYVDDLQTNLILFQATFDKDYHIILAESAAQALEILKEQDIQVLVTDQRMPDMSGTELLEIVSDDYPEIRRFLLTAFTDYETVVEAVNKGHIHGYINKPIQADDVRMSINNSLETYYLRKKNKEMVVELARVNTELMSLDGLKSEIIKVISQEIRDPLNRIMGTLHMLKDKIEGQELSDVVNILDSSVSKLEEFSSMTEQISILKSPGHQLKIAEVPMKRIIEYSVIEASEEMSDLGIELKFQNAAEASVIMGESHLLISCLVNMLRHAAAHTAEGGSITIRTEENGDQVICEVLDGGEQYDAQLVADLQDQFSNEQTKLNLNLGIELALSQMIMEAHSGKILFEKADGQSGAVKMLFRKGSEVLPVANPASA